ncbi:MAG: T9SS type A sorting domain-containing protein [Bacteroidales bacterium]|nr:T9SS type A sorting domain-containing protein [Bacteroidales bacterium]
MRKTGDIETGDIRIFELTSLSTFACQLPDNQRALRIYPNPTHGELHLGSATVKQVEVFDLNGTLVHLQQNDPCNSIDLSCLSKGQYLVRINTGNGTFTEKVLVY